MNFYLLNYVESNLFSLIKPVFYIYNDLLIILILRDLGTTF